MFLTLNKKRSKTQDMTMAEYLKVQEAIRHMLGLEFDEHNNLKVLECLEDVRTYLSDKIQIASQREKDWSSPKTKTLEVQEA
jgi:hypothetical protein